jgi:hypothetical protein
VVSGPSSSSSLHTHIGVRCVRELRLSEGEVLPTPMTDGLLTKIKDHSLPCLHHDVTLRKVGELQLVGAGGQLGVGVAIPIGGALLARLLVEDSHHATGVVPDLERAGCGTDDFDHFRLSGGFWLLWLCVRVGRRHGSGIRLNENRLDIRKRGGQFLGIGGVEILPPPSRAMHSN